MNFEYEWSKKDLEKELLDKRKLPNILFLVAGIFLYMWIMFFCFQSPLFDKKIIIIGLFAFCITLILILFILTKLYVMFSLKKNDKNTKNAYGLYKVNLSDDFIMVSINDQVIKYNYKDIFKFKKGNNRIFINTKEDKLGLVFKRKVIGDDNYFKILDKLKANV